VPRRTCTPHLAAACNLKQSHSEACPRVAPSEEFSSRHTLRRNLNKATRSPASSISLSTWLRKHTAALTGYPRASRFFSLAASVHNCCWTPGQLRVRSRLAITKANSSSIFPRWIGLTTTPIIPTTILASDTFSSIASVLPESSG
jgi:hypothetical protein